MKRLVLAAFAAFLVLVPAASAAPGFVLSAEQSWEPGWVLYTVDASSFTGKDAKRYFAIHHVCRDASNSVIYEKAKGISWAVKSGSSRKGNASFVLPAAAVSCSAWVFDAGVPQVPGDESGPLSNVLVYDPASLPPFDGF